MMAIRERLDAMPPVVFAAAVGLAASALYFLLAATIELAQIGPRLPYAPTPLVGLLAAVINPVLVVALFKGIGWVRPLIAWTPLSLYPLEYGTSLPPLLSVQAAELLICTLVLPTIAIYCFYFASSGKRWFSRTGSYMQ